MKSQRGFTLIEFLISMAILLLVAGVIFSFGRDLFSVNDFLQESLLIQSDVNRVMRGIISEIRVAVPSNTGTYPIELAGSTTLAFYANVDKDPIKERVHYFLSGGNLKKSVVNPAGQPLTYSTTTAEEDVKIVLRNVVASSTAPIFSYFDSYYAGTSTALTQPVDISSIRLISVKFIVDENPNLSPPAVIISSQVNVRSLKNN